MRERSNSAWKKFSRPCKRRENQQAPLASLTFHVKVVIPPSPAREEEKEETKEEGEEREGRRRRREREGRDRSRASDSSKEEKVRARLRWLHTEQTQQHHLQPTRSFSSRVEKGEGKERREEKRTRKDS